MSSVSADPGHPGFWVSRSKVSSECINSWTVVMICVLNIGNPYMLSVLVLEADLIADVWKYTDLLLRWENEIKLSPSFHLQQSCESDRTNTCSSVKLPTEVSVACVISGPRTPVHVRAFVSVFCAVVTTLTPVPHSEFSSCIIGRLLWWQHALRYFPSPSL